MTISFLFAVLVSACNTTSSFKGQTYKGDNATSVKEAMRASLRNTSLSEGLDILGEWQGYIETTGTIKAEYKPFIQSEVYRHRGDLCIAKADYMQAWDNYNKAILLDANNINALSNRVALYANNLNEFEWAKEGLHEILRKRPDFADAYFGMGQILDEQKQYKEAIYYYHKAIALDEKNEQYKANKSGAYARLYQSKTVREDAEELVKKYPGDIDAYRLRATFYYTDGRYQEAIDDYTIIISLETDALGQAAFYGNRAYAYSGLEKYKEAIQDFSKAIELQQIYTGILYASRGDMYLKIGENDKALADYMTGVENAGGSPVPYTMRGDYYMTVGKYAEAIDDYTEAINVFKFPDYYEKRAEAYRKSGNEEKAEEDEKLAVTERDKMK